MDTETSSELTASLVDQSEITDMLRRLAMTEGYFGSEQRGGDSKSVNDKYEYALNVLKKSPSSFIYQYRKELRQNELDFLQAFYKDDNMINLQISQIESDRKRQKTRVHNRRFAAMQKLMTEGDYFSDEQLKLREPYLYEQMVGKYLTEDEITQQVSKYMKDQASLSAIIFNQMDTNSANELYTREVDAENCCEEEVDTSDDSESEELSRIEDDDGMKISDDERLALREEFLHMMQEKFMNGSDSTFNYRDVDENEEYDDLDLEELDEQDKYFNEGSDSETTPCSQLTPDEYDY